MSTQIRTLPEISAHSLHDTSSVAEHPLGSYVETGDGRGFRYAKAGGSAITRGKLQCAPSPNTNHHDIAVNTASIGDTSLTVTLGATAATANEYAEGLVVVNDDTGEGTAYRIKSHPAADASASLVVSLEDPIDVAFVADTTVTLLHNPYNGVQESTTQTLQPAGVPLDNIAASEYGWVQVKGPCPVLADETLTLGAIVTIGSSVAGAVEEMDDVTAPITEPLVGVAVVAGVDAEYRPVNLTLN